MNVNWLELWDKLRDILNTKTNWGKAEILAEMDKLERRALRGLSAQESKSSLPNWEQS